MIVLKVHVVLVAIIISPVCQAADALRVRVDPLIVIKADEKDVTAVAFSPDGNLLAAGDEEGVVRLWKVSTGKLRATLKPKDASRERTEFHRLSFSPDGKALVAAGQSAHWRMPGPMTAKFTAWDVATGVERATFSRIAYLTWQMGFSTEGDVFHIEAQLRNSSVLMRFDTKNWVEKKPPLKLDHNFIDTMVEPSPDGAVVAVCRWDGTVSVCHAGNRNEISSIRDSSCRVAFSPDGKVLALVHPEAEGFIRFWPWRADKAKPFDLIIRMEVISVAFSPDGKLFATAGKGGFVKLWEVSHVMGFHRPRLAGTTSATAAEGRDIAQPQVTPF